MDDTLRRAMMDIVKSSCLDKRCEATVYILALQSSTSITCIDHSSDRQYSSEVPRTTAAFRLYGQREPTKLNFQAIKSLEFLPG